VARRGQAARVGSFVVLAAIREEEEQKEWVRLGVTVSRRVGKATTRNRVKRRIREWFRYQRPLMKSNLDIVVVARRTAAQISQSETIRVLDEGIRAIGAVL
jgi:ribonuclease P protein component